MGCQLERTHLDFRLLLNALLDAWIPPKDDDILYNFSVSCIILFFPDISNFLLSFLACASKRILEVHSSIKEGLQVGEF